MARLFAAGTSLEDIAAQLGCSISHVEAVLGHGGAPASRDALARRRAASPAPARKRGRRPRRVVKVVPLPGETDILAFIRLESERMASKARGTQLRVFGEKSDFANELYIIGRKAVDDAENFNVDSELDERAQDYFRKCMRYGVLDALVKAHAKKRTAEFVGIDALLDALDPYAEGALRGAHFRLDLRGIWEDYSEEEWRLALAFAAGEPCEGTPAERKAARLIVKRIVTRISATAERSGRPGELRLVATFCDRAATNRTTRNRKVDA